MQVTPKRTSQNDQQNGEVRLLRLFVATVVSRVCHRDAADNQMVLTGGDFSAISLS